MDWVRSMRSSWFPIFLGVAIIIFFLSDSLPGTTKIKSFSQPYRDGDEWVAPGESDIPFTDEGELIRYGKELVQNTAQYLGPRGSIVQITNGMNCQNCHLEAGTKNFAIPFSAVASTFPKWLDRSERYQSIESRVN